MRAHGPIIVSTSAPTQLRNLQLLRAMAAMAVVLQHALHDSWSLATKGATGRYALNFEYGVDIFFVISGFIMAHTMACEFGAPGAAKRFLWRRFARIVPLYWLLTTVLIIGGLAAPALLNVPLGDAWHVLASYLFIPDARVTGDVRPVLALGWTLDFEMFFYMLFAVALTLPMRRGVLWLSVAMIALSLVHVIVPRAPTPIGFWTNPIIIEFLFGIYVALIFRSGLRIGALAAAALALAGILGFLVDPPSSDEAQFLLRFAITGVPAALLVLAAAIGPAVGDSRILAGGVALGNASYSLYLVHPFVVRPIGALWRHFVGARLPAALYVGVCCIAAIVVALVLNRVLERPMTTFLQRLARGRAHRAGRGAPVLLVPRLRP